MDQSQKSKSSIEDKLELTFASPFYPRPAHAIWRDQTVRVTHLGDAAGMSPVFCIVDSSGRSQWVRQSEVEITDHERLLSEREELDKLSGKRSTSAGAKSSPSGSLVGSS